MYAPFKYQYTHLVYIVIQYTRHTNVQLVCAAHHLIVNDVNNHACNICGSCTLSSVKRDTNLAVFSMWKNTQWWGCYYRKCGDLHPITKKLYIKQLINYYACILHEVTVTHTSAYTIVNFCLVITNKWRWKWVGRYTLLLFIVGNISRVSISHTHYELISWGDHPWKLRKLTSKISFHTVPLTYILNLHAPFLCSY